ncbi:MAG: 50S ribosomal protein L9 [bacterium]|nr:50S ribosomal protein L9 [bacterium]
MQVVLNTDVKKLGFKGDTVSVKAGYFRNYLMPAGFADIATKARARVAESRKDKIVMKKEEIIAKSAETIDKLKGLTLTIKAKATDKGKLYGAVTEADLVEAVEKAVKIKLDKEFIKMNHFKEAGEYTALIHLGEGLDEEIKVMVEAVEEKKA